MKQILNHTQDSPVLFLNMFFTGSLNKKYENVSLEYILKKYKILHQKLQKFCLAQYKRITQQQGMFP